MEFGPRALGDRSIIGDARSPKMQSIMNLKIKYRECFRPFAPAVLEERRARVLRASTASRPYMLLVAPVRAELRCRRRRAARRAAPTCATWVNEARSDVPAVTHVDYSARIQTVDARARTRASTRILQAFEELTGCPVRGQHVLQRARRADRLHARGRLPLLHAHRDGHLVLEDCVLDKGAQPEFADAGDWQDDFVVD